MSAVSGQNPVFVGGFAVPVGQWSKDDTAVIADITTSGTRGTRGVGVISDISWQIELPHDDPFFVEAIGLGHGSIIPVMFFRHTQTVGDKLEFSVVETVSKVSNAKDVVRVTIRGKCGAITNNVAVPDFLIFPAPLLV